MMSFQLGRQTIEKAGRPFIIAEAGINHNGCIARAKAMIECAKQSGCDAIKFQTFKAREFCSDPCQLYTYTSQGKTVTESMLEMFERYEFTPQQWQALKHHAEQNDICFLSTPQNISDLELLLDIGIEAIKVGSDDFTNIPLLTRYAQTELPLILSCGMADHAEVARSLAAVNAENRRDIVLCLCTSQYPTPPEDINLRKLQTIHQHFPDVILGFSDHSQGPLASSLAVTLGSVVFEKHFTLSHQLPGPDHWFSEDPDGLKTWVAQIRYAYQMLGSPILEPTPAEKKMRILARRSIVSTQNIVAGERLTQENIGLKRPGDGLEPALYPTLLNKIACRDIAAGEKLTTGDFK